ncbi:MAG: acyl-CoA thioesterase [Leptospirales bacterium]|nr:acyl-CoA thioesterase [Leptospirales bacterium]
MSHLPADSTELDGYDVVTRHLVMERHLNAFGNLFGGVMLAWLDEGSALYVMDRIGYQDFVTVHMDNVNFRSPARRGDAVALYSRVQKVGRSSITVETRALVHEAGLDQRREVIACQITFVCLRDGRPFAYFESPEYRSYSKKHN